LVCLAAHARGGRLRWRDPLLFRADLLLCKYGLDGLIDVCLLRCCFGYPPLDPLEGRFVQLAFGLFGHVPEHGLYGLSLSIGRNNRKVACHPPPLTVLTDECIGPRWERSPLHETFKEP